MFSPKHRIISRFATSSPRAQISSIVHRLGPLHLEPSFDNLTFHFAPSHHLIFSHDASLNRLRRPRPFGICRPLHCSCQLEHPRIFVCHCWRHNTLLSIHKRSCRSLSRSRSWRTSPTGTTSSLPSPTSRSWTTSSRWTTSSQRTTSS